MSFNDYCFGTGTVHWSDDSYAHGSHDCPGCGHAKCPAKREENPIISKTEEEAARADDARAVSNPSDAGVTVKVMIPVAITSIGPRDRLEHYGPRNMTVEFDGSQVTLRADPLTQAGTDSISFPWAGIEAAIGMLGSLS